jgi:hypothetical protein
VLVFGEKEEFLPNVSDLATRFDYIDEKPLLKLRLLTLEKVGSFSKLGCRVRYLLGSCLVYRSIG